MNDNMADGVEAELVHPLSDASCGSANRTKAEIAEKLALSGKLHVIEIASGFGVHIEHLAQVFPDCEYQPTEAQLKCMEKLQEISSRYPNIYKPMFLNVLSSQQWSLIKADSIDVLLAFNLIHVSPPEVTRTLFLHANRILRPRGQVILYGAFRRHGKITSAGDEEFERLLKKRDPKWGLRDLDGIVQKIADTAHFSLITIIQMASNNLLVRFELRQR